MIMMNTSIKSNDILCGRGRGIARRTGNRRFRMIISLQLPCYLCASRAEKSLIINSTVDAMKQDGCRFLKKFKKQWVELDENQVREKVAHAFRDMASSSSERISPAKRNGLGSLKKDENSGDENSQDGDSLVEPICVNSWRSSDLISLFCHRQANQTLVNRNHGEVTACHVHSMLECNNLFERNPPSLLSIFTSICFSKNESEWDSTAAAKPTVC